MSAAEENIQGNVYIFESHTNCKKMLKFYFLNKTMHFILKIFLGLNVTSMNYDSRISALEENVSNFQSGRWNKHKDIVISEKN